MSTLIEPSSQTPIQFPLPALSESSYAALKKEWQRHDLQRYLKRWENAYVPDIPKGIWDFKEKILDIGCGLGKYILNQAENNKNQGYLGIDKGTIRGGKMTHRIKESGLDNIFGIHGNAIPLVASMPDSLFDRITVWYPNPWWPPKHRKKRWSYHPLLPEILKKLKPGGEFWLATNEAFYLKEIETTLNNYPNLTLGQIIYLGPIQEKTGRTHFETNFINHQVACGEIRFKKQ